MEKACPIITLLTKNLRFDVLVEVVAMEITVFWAVTLCSQMDIY